MALLDLVIFPDERLRKVAEEVKDITPEICRLVENMYETMYYSRGIGLAATQVSSSHRIFVSDLTGDHSAPRCFINPVITDKKGEVALEEGCLSFPGVYATVIRPEEVTIEAMDIEGKSFTITADGYEARCLLHELDHLNGIVYFDYLSPLKRQMLERKLKKYKKAHL